MSADVHAWADQLRQYATHFVDDEWKYGRDLNGLHPLRYDDPYDRLWIRIKAALKYASPTWRPADWELVMFPNIRSLRSRLRMAKGALRWRRHYPDGCINGGFIITNWEETGEYLQHVQPSVGRMLADWMDDEPESPHAKRIAGEMKRINDRYGERVGDGTGTPPDSG